ncbi:hypothetical protein ACP70R_043795 [Stipagrostis hirtigluma subsp. patula]
MGYDQAVKALVLSFVLGAVAGVPPSKIARQVPAMYVFGDSTLDVGNNNHLPGKDVPRANKAYYGIDLPGSGKPTGRFSNGYNTADFVAKTLGFEKSPMAYLALKARNVLAPGALSRGVSYASAGGWYSRLHDNAGNNIPLSTQVRYFASTKAEMVAKAGPRAVGGLLSRSFFLVGVGSNDMFAFATALARQNRSPTPTEVAAFYSSLISNYSAAITELYALGARKFGIINVGGVGCVPWVRAQNAAGACSDELNQLAVGFDGGLRTLLAGLARKLPGLAYSLADSFRLSSVTDPVATKFASADSACCGGGRLGAAAACAREPGVAVCANRDQYVFWDWVHPSQRAAELSAQAYYDGPAQFTEPINFKQLAQKRF